MKNKILTLMLVGGLLASCNDAIDITQPGEVNDPLELFRTPKDVERGVNLIYSAIPIESEIGFNAIFTDEVAIGKDNGGQGLIGGEYTFLMLAGNDFAASNWVGHYYMINRINRTIEATKVLIKQNPADEAAYKTSLFELYVLRAYANLKLFAYYTPDYTNMNGYSVIKLDYIPQGINEKPGRATVAEIRQFILDDLQAATDLGASARSGDQRKSYVNYAMIDAIKVKLFAMTEEYGEIEALVSNITSNPLYSLKGYSNPTNFGQQDLHTQFVQFKNEETVPDAQTDVIFKLKRTVNQGGSVASNFYSTRVSMDGAVFYEMSRGLYNALDKLDPTQQGLASSVQRNDIRYYINLLPTSLVATNYQTISDNAYASQDVLLIGKYPGRNNALLKADVPVFRTPDLVLALAEAKAAQGAFMPSSMDPDDIVGDYSTVYGIIFNLRFLRLINPTNVATIQLPTITNSQDAYKLILDERRVELAYEGHRYLDIKRLGAKAGLSNGVDRYVRDCQPHGACELPISSFKFTLPIPILEINANTTIRSQQNPGY